MPSSSVVLLIAAARLAGVEFAIPDRPVAVTDEVIAGRAATWVDWGAAGASRARDAELIGEERDGLRRWLSSPEVAAKFVQLSLQADAKEQDLLRERLAEWHEEYARREQPTALPRATHRTRDTLPLPVWAYGLPLDIRASTQVLIFDDRDPAQRAWVQQVGRDPGRASFAYCTGWRSGQDRDDFWKDHPGVSIHPVATDQFAVFYGVTAYPARVVFGPDAMDVEQGLDP